ncbi:MAG: N-6 DNA methylase [Clostridiales bacterium]|nr:N-6 DNA methylase [Clostridiales bacterium]
MEWIIDDISEVLAVTDVNKILHDYFHEGKGKDPIVHFYETFLAEYDPQTREKRGVYYTPEPVVSYIVRSLHYILKKHFNRPDGLASETVTVLDPAAGTLTFLAEAAKLAVKEFVSSYGEGAKADFIRDHILRNFYAFELMMAPYAVGHLKMSFLLEELGYKLQKDDRFKLYLTNTLEMEELAQSELPGMVSLSEESHLAGRVKKETPILVIMGNPPYSGHSANRGPWIDDLLKKGYTLSDGTKDDGYYQVDGKALGEKNPKWLQDDYVKFIRFAQWKIDQAGEGVLGFISNHSYLDNPTFRGMRQSLMKSFDEIYVLDLHGNCLKKEKCPDGSKDENVFDIMQGVAIALFIKKKGTKKGCPVHHSEVWGLREKKYGWLEKKDIKTTKWEKISPKSEFYLFIPREERLLKAYEKYLKITEIFNLYGVGMTTARDKFVIHGNKAELLARIARFKNSRLSDGDLHAFFQIIKKKGWDIRKAWHMLQSIPDSDLDKYALPVLYRPFDSQWIFYHDSVVWRTVKRVMQHMMQENLGLITSRQMDKSGIQPIFITVSIIDAHSITSAVSISNLFPLYLYSDENKEGLFSNKIKPEKRKPNIDLKILRALAEGYRKEPAPEEIFYYIYAVLYSNTYRTKYAEFLKIDFPRVPFTKGYRLFCRMVEFGNKLVELHLLKSRELEHPVARFRGKDENKVEKVRYEKGRAYINDDQYFEDVRPEVWEYQIGGYQVCAKWLKDRKGRKLSLPDIKHYCKIVTALENTIAVQNEIDKLYPKVEEDVIDYQHSVG